MNREGLVSQYRCCMRCLGRTSPAVGSIELDSSINSAEQFTTAITEKTVAEQECQICHGSVVAAIEMSDRLIRKLKEFEFSTILVGCALTDELQSSDKILENFCEEYQDLKFEIRKEVGLRIVKALEKEVDFKYPDISAVVDTKKFRYNLDIRPLYILGKYKKLTRGLPQTKWPCSSCKGRGCEACNQTGQQYPKTVETVIAPYFLEASGAIDESFHGAGREDIDALMLGTGRPFVLELKEPKVRSLDLNSLENQVNLQQDVEITDLRFCEKEIIAMIKQGAPDARKSYRAIVSVEGGITELQIEMLNKLGKEKIILDQQTPLRVSHRRADLIRKKAIYHFDVKSLSENSCIIDIEAQGGAYIKEFISGDGRRTIPSITEFLQQQAVCTELDVIAVDDKGLFS